MRDGGQDTDRDVPVILAIDGNSLVHRAYHSHARTAAVSGDGSPCWAVRGLLMQLVAAVERVRPVAVVVGFDDPDTSSRRDRWPGYKAQRGDKLETLVDQLAMAVTVLRELGVAVVIPPGLEADDVVASTAAHARRNGHHAVVVTSDRDAFALIDDTTRVLRIINGGVDASPMMTPDRLELLIGIRPHQYRDFAALRGDPSDNLPGVRGIGPRSAARLLKHFGSARAAFDDLTAVHDTFGRGLAARLSADGARPAWELNCAVMTMHTDLELADEPGGRISGALPLPAPAVRRAFGALNLTWTTRDALRVLADVETADEPQPRPELPSWTGMGTTGWARTGRRPLPPLAPRRPQPAQLSLFD